MTSDRADEERAEVLEFEGLRRRLCAAAYAVTGSIAEAEDIVQDVWLKWDGVDRSTVREAEAFLVTSVSRLAIDRLRSARVRREVHVGPWLPEPVVGPVDPADVVAEAEQVSMAFLVALERLSIDERIVLVLRDVGDLDYVTIGGIVDRPAATCRKLVERARSRVAEPHRRRPVDPARVEGLFASLLAALAEDDLDELVQLLSLDVTLTSDGGATRRAARRVVEGPERVARFLTGVNRNSQVGDELLVITVNAEPGVAVLRDGRVHSVLFALVDETGGSVAEVLAVLDPPKLRSAEQRIGVSPGGGVA